MSDHVAKKQHNMLQLSPISCRILQIGDKVSARSFSARGIGWKEGEIVKICGDRHYMVKVDNQLWKRY